MVWLFALICDLLGKNINEINRYFDQVGKSRIGITLAQSSGQNETIPVQRKWCQEHCKCEKQNHQLKIRKKLESLKKWIICKQCKWSTNPTMKRRWKNIWKFVKKTNKKKHGITDGSLVCGENFLHLVLCNIECFWLSKSPSHPNPPQSKMAATWKNLHKGVGKIVLFQLPQVQIRRENTWVPQGTTLGGVACDSLQFPVVPMYFQGLFLAYPT